MASTFRLRPRYRLGRTWRVDGSIKPNFSASCKGHSEKSQNTLATEQKPREEQTEKPSVEIAGKQKERPRQKPRSIFDSSIDELS